MDAHSSSGGSSTRTESSQWRRRARLVAAGAAIAAAGAIALAGRSSADHSDGVGMSFTFLSPGFTQDLYATHLPFAVGVAFAPDGDPMLALATMYRVDSQGDEPNVHGDELHPVTTLPNGTQWVGITNNPDGTLYSNTSSGVTNLDPDTGALLRGPFGNPGNTLGIATDPQTGNIVYADGFGTVSFVDQTFTTTGLFSNHSAGYDGIAFDPSGEFLFLADFVAGGVTILKRDGSFVQTISVAPQCCADGMAFHADVPHFVITNNTDGTMTRLDFPSDDFTQAPSTSVFASGGFRGDLSAVRTDGCLYLSQGGTRFEDGTTSGEGSLVRLCGGFVPVAGVENCTNGIDDDGDDLVDCADPNCANDPTCVATPTPVETSTPIETPTPTATATPSGLCGNGVVDPGETCDDGNTVGGCRTDLPQKPIDNCNADCTRPMCKDPARIYFRDGLDRLRLHGRIAPDAARRTFGANIETFVVRLTAGGTVVFDAALSPDEMASGGSGSGDRRFVYRRHDTHAAGGITFLDLRRRDAESYTVTIEAEGDLSATTSPMTTHVFVNGEEWTVGGEWTPTLRGWRWPATR